METHKFVGTGSKEEKMERIFRSTEVMIRHFIFLEEKHKTLERARLLHRVDDFVHDYEFSRGLRRFEENQEHMVLVPR